MEEEQAPPSQPVSTVQRPSLIASWGPVAAIAAVIVTVSSIPGSNLPRHPDALNSAAHFLEFGLLGFFLCKAIAEQMGTRGMPLLFLSTLICGTFGFLDEAHQFLVPYRVFDIMDLFFDTTGALSGGVVFLGISRKREDEAGD